jgi:hypothetical protein
MANTGDVGWAALPPIITIRAFRFFATFVESSQGLSTRSCPLPLPLPPASSPDEPIRSSLDALTYSPAVLNRVAQAISRLSVDVSGLGA